MSQNTTVKITNELEMLGFLKANGTACRFVSITIRTPVVGIKAGNPFHVVKNKKVVGKCKLFKLSRKLGLINANYNTSVRRRIAEKLGVDLPAVEYENGEVWYEHLKTSDGKNLPIVQHKDETKREETGYSLQYLPHKTFQSEYVTDTGELVPKEKVTPWLYAESARVDWKPAVIAPKLRNIVQLKASGIVMESPDFEAAEAILAQ